MTQQQAKANGESRKADSTNGQKGTGTKADGQNGSFDPARYLIQLPKRKKVTLPNGRITWQKTEADYLPVAARIAWFRIEHPTWSIITKEVKSARKATVMKAIIKDEQGRVLTTARKRESQDNFPDYIEKAETGAIDRALAMCGYGTLQAPEFDEENGWRTRRSRRRRGAAESCQWSGGESDQATREGLTKAKLMTDKKMNTYGMTADLSNFSGFSDAPCATCRRKTTNAQYSYSMRFYSKPLCRGCQKLEDYEEKWGDGRE